MTKLSLTGYRTYRFLQVDLSDETLRRTKNSTNRRFYYEDKNLKRVKDESAVRRRRDL